MAREGLLPSVGPDMDIDAVFIFEAFVADVAIVEQPGLLLGLLLGPPVVLPDPLATTSWTAVKPLIMLHSCLPGLRSWLPVEHKVAGTIHLYADHTVPAAASGVFALRGEVRADPSVGEELTELTRGSTTL